MTDLELLRGRGGSIRELDIDLEPLHLVVRVLVGDHGHGVGHLKKIRVAVGTGLFGRHRRGGTAIWWYFFVSWRYCQIPVP